EAASGIGDARESQEMSVETDNVRAASAWARGMDLEGVAGRELSGAGRAAGRHSGTTGPE
ncbi:MAG TPA: hypothetical protein VL242_25855, partial [Sorangium sp.]|nr:hypothetical protein [Sorangium sp.]